jgi:hypothetical protein
MSSPYSGGRDSNADPSNRFDATSTVSDDHLGSFQDSFAPPTGANLAEKDYRDTPTGGTGSIPNPTDHITERQDTPMAPGEYGYPTPRPGGFVPVTPPPKGAGTGR